MNYLALGDSYTIGELLPFEENFPSQVVALLNRQNVPIKLKQLIAVTGWTTDELSQGIQAQQPIASFDWVTLLIGVNNQYRERSTEEYATQFEDLLNQALHFAQNNPQHVIVLSIPDWGLTPFNTVKDKQQISAEIDSFNAINKAITLEAGVHYLNITSSTREHAKDPHYLAPDFLHYSKHEYAIWANAVANIVYQQYQLELSLQGIE